MIALCDTNVLVRIINPADPLHQVASSAILHLQSRDWDIAITPQVVYEYWTVATRPTNVNGLGHSQVQTWSNVEQMKRQYSLLMENAGVYPLWEKLVHMWPTQGKQAHDARLVAMMQLHQVTHLLTFNVADFKRYSMIEVLEPAQITTLVP